MCFFCGSFLLFMSHGCLCYAVLSVPSSLMITCWEGLTSWLSCVLCFLCFYGVLCHGWYLIDLCLPLYFCGLEVTCKCVCSDIITITQCRSIQGTVKKSHRTLTATRHQGDYKSGASNSLRKQGKTRKDRKYCITKQGPYIKPHIQWEQQ